MKFLTKFSLFIFLVVLLSCNNSSKADSSGTDEIPESAELPVDFLNFLDEFHGDEEFQLAHIRFPLQGLPSMMDESSSDMGQYRWTKDDWVMHKGFDQDNEEFEQSFKLYGEDMVVEHIVHINGQTGMERRFSKSEDSWDLIYYAAMNFIKQ